MRIENTKDLSDLAVDGEGESRTRKKSSQIALTTRSKGEFAVRWQVRCFCEAKSNAGMRVFAMQTTEKKWNEVFAVRSLRCLDLGEGVRDLEFGELKRQRVSDDSG